MGSRIKNILVIPDNQFKPGSNLKWIPALKTVVSREQITHIVHLGDLWDFPSLFKANSVKELRNLSLTKDFEAGLKGFEEINKATSKVGNRYFCEGNHENRVNRWLEDYPHLDVFPEPGKVIEGAGWFYVPFLRPLVISKIQFSHYFVRGPDGTVMQSKRGHSNAVVQAKREMMSTVSGHKQGISYHTQETAGGRIRSIIAGSCYLDRMGYLTAQGEDHWKGLVVLHNAKAGDYDIREYSMRTLLKLC